MTTYVLGFAFSKDMDQDTVLLIRKERPDWQKGKWNGIGGKVEEDESPLDAMVREFREESGLDSAREDWTQFCRISGPNYSIKVYSSFNLKIEQHEFNHDELVRETHVKWIRDLPQKLGNLEWLVAMALDVRSTNKFSADIFYTERQDA